MSHPRSDRPGAAPREGVAAARACRCDRSRHAWAGAPGCTREQCGRRDRSPRSAARSRRGVGAGAVDIADHPGALGTAARDLRDGGPPRDGGLGSGEDRVLTLEPEAEAGHGVGVKAGEALDFHALAGDMADAEGAPTIDLGEPRAASRVDGQRQPARDHRRARRIAGIPQGEPPGGFDDRGAHGRARDGRRGHFGRLDQGCRRRLAAGPG